MGSIRDTAHLVDIGQGLLEGGVSPETIVTTCPHLDRLSMHVRHTVILQCSPIGLVEPGLLWVLWVMA